ncbi:MAG: hypothetical protein HZB33_05785 [Nitrospirae bacterium]|nr:hypothetical protein [Nitrospirota bacterium]
MFRIHGQRLEIPNTLDVLIAGWTLAEENLRNDIASCYPDADGEFITQRFHGKYGAILSYASECKHIENAFLRDIQKAFPELKQELHQIASGLIAEITLHKKATEKITGGDIGLLIIRPNIHDHGHYLKISDYRRGLLCQAKLKNQKGKWGRFTERQTEVLPERLSYLSLLFYSYIDDARRSLNPFQWQLCDSFNFSEVQHWLKTDNFPSLVTSDNIIANLGYGNIGTDNDDIIDSIISPSKNPVLIIRVTWPDNKRPGGPSSSVRIYSRQENHSSQQIQIRH